MKFVIVLVVGGIIVTCIDTFLLHMPHVAFITGVLHKLTYIGWGAVLVLVDRKK